MVSQLTSSITLDSLSKLPKSSVAVCAFDAGAASHMAAWLAPLHPHLRLCLGGPAEELFRARLGSSMPPMCSLDQALDDAKVLISGTGWATDTEHEARVLARAKSIPIVAVLDHWTNYAERFCFHNHQCLPDVIWVADLEAYSKAKAIYPAIPVIRLSNYCMQDICATAKRIRRSRKLELPIMPAKRLLYLLEPVRVPWQVPEEIPYINHLDPGEFQALRFFLQTIPCMVELGIVAPTEEIASISLRLHPSEPTDKYNDIVNELSEYLPIQLDPCTDLAESLACSDIAFGCETQALAVAMECGLPAYSTLPPWAHECRLPHRALGHLRSLSD